MGAEHVRRWHYIATYHQMALHSNMSEDDIATCHNMTWHNNMSQDDITWQHVTRWHHTATCHKMTLHTTCHKMTSQADNTHQTFMSYLLQPDVDGQDLVDLVLPTERQGISVASCVPRVALVILTTLYKLCVCVWACTMFVNMFVHHSCAFIKI